MNSWIHNKFHVYCGKAKDGLYGRYWKEVFEFNGMKFLATSQWYERHREPFIQWLARLQDKKRHPT
ncbi:MAG TPA: hypothetical protein VFD00_12630 [Thermoclostridium sp.]|nr:hypothetical protein [Thermoclostridium sp.]